MTDLRLHRAARDYQAPSVFRPENLLREARRQKGLPWLDVPAVCVLDPDGDLVGHVVRHHAATAHPGWACYHTELCRFELRGRPVGVVGHAVGGSFAVLVAEQLFASGCRLLISITSAGRIGDLPPEGCFLAVERALRDEGTSYHYLPPDVPAECDPGLLDRLWPALAAAGAARRGTVWTTDAPYRETEQAIAAARDAGALAVEMEAASLYAFGRARAAAVLCLAHVTNAMARTEGDFEKGEGEGAPAALALIEAAVVAWWRTG